MELGLGMGGCPSSRVRMGTLAWGSEGSGVSCHHTVKHFTTLVYHQCRQGLQTQGEYGWMGGCRMGAVCVDDMDDAIGHMATDDMNDTIGHMATDDMNDAIGHMADRCSDQMQV